MTGYFKNFPTTSYANTAAVDLTRRVVIDDKFRDNPFAFYPYTIKEHDRADTIGLAYYNQSDRAWLVYLSMGIRDPYYDWPVDNEVFEKFVRSKYGSSEEAKQQVLFWRLDWSDADAELTPADFELNIPEPLKKYYEAQYGEGANILSWRRRREDWQSSTNIVATLDIESANGTYTPDERATISTGNTVTANVTIAFANATHAVVENVFGNVETTGVLTGLSSGVTMTVTGLQEMANSIPVDERPFWSPVYAYDFEVESNAQKKFSRLVDERYTGEIEAGLKTKLNT